MRSHGKGTFLKSLENPDKNLMEYLYEVQCDDLIVNITFAWEGAIAIAKPTDRGALVSHRFPTYVFKRDVAIPDFFRYIILDKQLVYKLGVISPGGAGRNRVLNKNDFLKLRVFLPKVSEQQKVADCLTQPRRADCRPRPKTRRAQAIKQG
jgi:type I restriction enzyme S subunit